MSYKKSTDHMCFAKHQMGIVEILYERFYTFGENGEEGETERWSLAQISDPFDCEGNRRSSVIEIVSNGTMNIFTWLIQSGYSLFTDC